MALLKEDQVDSIRSEEALRRPLRQPNLADGSEQPGELASSFQQLRRRARLPNQAVTKDYRMVCDADSTQAVREYDNGRTLFGRLQSC